MRRRSREHCSREVKPPTCARCFGLRERADLAAKAIPWMRPHSRDDSCQPGARGSSGDSQGIQSLHAQRGSRIARHKVLRNRPLQGSLHRLGGCFEWSSRGCGGARAGFRGGGAADAQAVMGERVGERLGVGAASMSG